MTDPAARRDEEDGEKPRRRWVRGLAIVVALVLVLAAAAGYVIEGGLGPVPVRPSPAPSAAAPSAASSVVPAASGSPAVAGSPAAAALDAEIAAVEAQVPPLRGLEPLATVPTRVIDAAQLRTLLISELDAPATAAATVAEQDLLVRLGMADPGVDLRAVSLAMLTSQVLGLYDPASRSMVAVDRNGDFGLVGRFTIAHEYTHALQDQHFDFARLGVNDAFPTDRVLAVRALIEGDASLLGSQWLPAHVTLADLPEIAGLVVQAMQPVVPPGTPPLVGAQLLFPYLDGLSFATSLHAAGGWAAVDAAYARLPSSTAEILHPERYAAGWAPTAVMAPDLSRALGPGWSRTREDTLGELTFRTWLGGSAGTAAASLAANWQGDGLASWTGPGGAWAIAWRSTWTTGQAAGSVAVAAGALLDTAVTSGGSGPHAVRVADRSVTLYVASDVASLGRIAAAGPAPAMGGPAASAMGARAAPATGARAAPAMGSSGD